jgi:enamine deaminase RidA (YjgF/YER057c/UK114 family)
VWANLTAVLREAGMGVTNLVKVTTLLSDRADAPVNTGVRSEGEPWKQSVRVRTTVAECEMRLAAARSAVYSSVEAQWKRLVASEPMTRHERAHAALARYRSFRVARDITEAL